MNKFHIFTVLHQGRKYWLKSEKAAGVSIIWQLYAVGKD